jgi:hypothetical protein
LDIATGLPTQNNVHEVAQRLAPESRVVYVDNDPVVLAHAGYLLRSGEAGPTGLAGSTGSTAFVFGDFNEPEKIVQEAGNTLDLGRPVAVILFGILHFIEDDEKAAEIMKYLVDAVPSGSYFAFSHFARGDEESAMDETFERLNRQWGESVVRRTREEVARLLAGLDLVEPGVVELPDWRPDPGSTGPRPLPMWCGVAYKP